MTQYYAAPASEAEPSGSRICRPVLCGARTPLPSSLSVSVSRRVSGRDLGQKWNRHPQEVIPQHFQTSARLGSGLAQAPGSAFLFQFNRLYRNSVY